MHFAALVALAVVGSSILGLAAPVPNSHPQLEVTSKRDDDDIIKYFPSERSLDPVFDSVTATHIDDSIIQNKRSTPTPVGGVHVLAATAAVDQSTSSGDTKRYAASVIQPVYNVKRQAYEVVISDQSEVHAS